MAFYANYILCIVYVLDGVSCSPYYPCHTTTFLPLPHLPTNTHMTFWWTMVVWRWGQPGSGRDIPCCGRHVGWYLLDVDDMVLDRWTSRLPPPTPAATPASSPAALVSYPSYLLPFPLSFLPTTQPTALAPQRRFTGIMFSSTTYLRYASTRLPHDTCLTTRGWRAGGGIRLRLPCARRCHAPRTYHTSLHHHTPRSRCMLTSCCYTHALPYYTPPPRTCTRHARLYVTTTARRTRTLHTMPARVAPLPHPTHTTHWLRYVYRVRAVRV